MILLVVGLVAVIVVILIAVFLSIRLGRGDEHDDEAEIRSGSRDQRAEEDRWREPDGRDTRQSPQPSRAAGRGAGERHSSRDDDRRRGGEPAYSGARERGPAPARRASDRDYEEGPRRPARRDSSEYESSPARRRSADPAPAETRGRHDGASSRRAAADDFAADGYPSVDSTPDEYTAEYAAPDYPSRDSGQYAADDFPSEELPAAPARSAKRPAAKARPDADRPDSHRKAAPEPAPGKSRSRQHRGKRDDTDDWPSSEWDKLSDEQYWAELSADKPLATMAKPASSAKAAPAGPPAAKPSREKRDTRPAKTAAVEGPEELSRAGAAASRSPELVPPEREQGRGRRERPPQREAVTERLPVRSRQQPPVPAAWAAAEAPAATRPIPAGTHPSLDTGRYPVGDAGRHPSLDAGFAVTGDTGAHAVPGAGSLPTRDIGRHPSLDAGFPAAPATGQHPSLDAGFPAGPAAGRHPSLDTGPHATRDPSLAMLTGLAGTPPPPVPGALEDDPLTSPSFSLKADPATDSRSYGHARKASRPATTGNGSTGPLPSVPLTSNGASHAGRHDSGSYPAADYASPTYTYPAEPVPAPAAPAVPAEWYSSPPAEPAPAVAYGNPYSYPEAGTGGSPAGPAAGPGYNGYLTDPLHVYSPPPYESPASTAYPDPSGAAYPALPTVGMAAPAMSPAGGRAYPGAYPEQPYGQEQGHLQPPQYPDAPGGAGYTPSYDGGYAGDPYAAGEYGTYPSQG